MRYNHYTWRGRNALTYSRIRIMRYNPGVEVMPYLIQETETCGITITPGVEEMP